NTFSDEPDPLTITGQTTGSTNGQATRGSRDAWSVFWEARVPVTGPTWNFPGAYSLEFGYAERFESYSDFGTTERPKFDVRSQPISFTSISVASPLRSTRKPSLIMPARRTQMAPKPLGFRPSSAMVPTVRLPC